MQHLSGIGTVIGCCTSLTDISVCDGAGGELKGGEEALQSLTTSVGVDKK